MKIDFEIIAFSRMRYPSSGDWFRKGGVWFFRVARFKDKRYSFLVFFHEFIEWGICQLQGIKQRDVDRFDMAYEKARDIGEAQAPCGCKFQDECGDDIHAPYREAHQVATACERLIAKALGVDWA